MVDVNPPATPWILRAMRPVLWVGVAFNLVVAGMVLFPATLGALAALPPVGSEFYRWMLAYFVVLFAATYAWLARQPRIPHALVGLASLGRLGVVAVALACVLLEKIELRTFLLTGIDLAFAAYFAAWMRASLRAGR